MPVFRSISVELHSQFDIETLPEYFPRPQAYYDSLGITTVVPKLVDKENTTCSVYVPALPGSQFWLSYMIAPPIPDEQLFVFKLFINGTHIVTWSTGKDEEWQGKAVYSLYALKKEYGDEASVEKRVFCFTPPDRGGNWDDVAGAFDLDACVEVRVYRSNGKRRIARELQEYGNSPYAPIARGVHLVNAGRAGGGHPKRFYQFALIDPLDAPYARFRFYYRTWKQIEKLGVLGYWGEGRNDNTSEDSLSIIEPFMFNTDENSEYLTGMPLAPSFDVATTWSNNYHAVTHDLPFRLTGGPQHVNDTYDRIHDTDGTGVPIGNNALPLGLPLPPPLRLDPPRPPSRPRRATTKNNEKHFSSSSYTTGHDHEKEELSRLSQDISPRKANRRTLTSSNFGKRAEFLLGAMAGVKTALKRHGSASKASEEKRAQIAARSKSR